LVDMAHCIFLNAFSKVHAHGLWSHLSISMANGHTYPFPWPMATQSVSMAYDRTCPFPWPNVHGVSMNG
jgi:hypothetical protein